MILFKVGFEQNQVVRILRAMTFERTRVIVALNIGPRVCGVGLDKTIESKSNSLEMDRSEKVMQESWLKMKYESLLGQLYWCFV